MSIKPDPIPKAVRDHVTIPEIPRLTVLDVLQWRTLPPPEVMWLLFGLLAMREAGCLAGRSNCGKGFILFLLILATTTGRDMFGCKGCGKPMKAILLEMEDSPEELQRRMFRLLQLMRQDPTWTNKDEENLFNNLVILTPNWQSTEERTLTGLFPTIKTKIDEIHKGGDTVGLVVLDTLAALSEGDENAVEAQRASLAVLYQLRDLSGACVLAVHHLRKGSSSSKASSLLDRLNFDALRGTSAITASARFIIQVEPLTVAEAVKLGLDEDKASRGGYVVMALTKVVSGPKGSMLLLEQLEGVGGGFWAPHPRSDELCAQLQSKSAAASLSQDESVLLSIAGGITDRTELGRMHWPQIDPMQAAPMLKAVLNRLRNRHHWLEAGKSMELTAPGRAKAAQLRRTGNQPGNQVEEDLENVVDFQ